MKIKLIGTLVLAALLLIIVFQNSEPVTVELLFWKISMSGILLYPLIFVIGIGAGWAAHFVYQNKINKKGE